MTSPWTISAAAERIDLDPAGHAEATFTVTNSGPVDQRLVFDVVAGDGTDRAWFTTVEPQVLVAHGRSHTFLVRVDVPAGTPAGARWFAGRAYSADRAPEESSVVSNRVAVEVKPTVAPVPWWRRYWWLFVVAALVVVALVVVLVLVLDGGESGTAVPGESPTVAPTRVELTPLVNSPMSIQAANPFDFDTLTARLPDDQADIQFVASGPNEPRFIEPINGAQLTKIGPADDPGQACAAASFGTDQVAIDSWQRDEILCVNTSEGRLATAVLRDRFNIANRSPVLGLDIATFEVG